MKKGTLAFFVALTLLSWTCLSCAENDVTPDETQEKSTSEESIVQTNAEQNDGIVKEATLPKPEEEKKEEQNPESNPESEPEDAEIKPSENEENNSTEPSGENPDKEPDTEEEKEENGESTSALRIYIDGALMEEDGLTVHIGNADNKITIGWNATATEGGFQICVTADNDTVLNDSVSGNMVSVSAALLMGKSCTAAVSASGESGASCSDRITFRVVVDDSDDKNSGEGTENIGGDPHTLTLWVDNAKETDGVWKITPGKDNPNFVIGWQADGGEREYIVTISNADGIVYSGEPTSGTSLSLPIGEYSKGSYLLTVSYTNDEGTLVTRTLTFEVSEEGFPGKMPGGFHGGFGKGNLGSMGGMPTEGEAVFTIIPGVSLTDSHVTGDKDMSLYNTVELVCGNEAMTELVVGGRNLDIGLSEKGVFTATILDGVMTLTSTEPNALWHLNGRALKILSQSGLKSILLKDATGETEILAAQEYSGTVYGKLRAHGYASVDFDYTLNNQESLVTVGDVVYEPQQDGTLRRVEEEA